MQLFLICTIAVLVAGCSEQTGPEVGVILSDYPVPEGLPPIPVPPDNPITSEKIALGRMLFYDPALSRDGTLSCASCHRQSHAFSDSLPVSHGTNNQVGLRNAPPLINIAYAQAWFWDGRARSLEEQIMAALTSPIEMGSDTALISARIMAQERYHQAFRQAFGRLPSARDAIRALATFCRVLVSGNSRYDRYRRGDSTALTAAERRGMQLFFSQRTGCATCHSGIHFTDFDFHSIGIHSHYYDRGRYYVTGDERDIGKFKTPTLRNVALTAPYMNDGIFPTLDDVLEHYNIGGKLFKNKDSRIRPLGLTSAELADLRAFLEALTDSTFITDPRFAKP